MTTTRNGLWIGLLTLGVLSLGLNLYQVRRQAQLRRDLWPQACQPCVSASLDDTALLLQLLAAPRRGRQDLQRYDAALERLRGCSQKILSLQPETSADGFYEPLQRLQFWQDQAVQLGENCRRLDPRSDGGTLRTAVQAMRGMLANQANCANNLGQAAVSQLDLQGDALASAQAWAKLGHR